MKILQIGNYPPPMCGWAIQTKLLVNEIRRRGHICDVLNINESRKQKSDEYVDVQSGFDYAYKLLRFARRGYRFQMHVNGQSKPGYALAMLAAIVGRATGRPIALSWQGGAEQKYFPRRDRPFLRWAYRQLFKLSGTIFCNSEQIKRIIVGYGIDADRVIAIPAFSRQNLEFRNTGLDKNAEAFLDAHAPVFFSYVSFRPEYRLSMLREAMNKFRDACPSSGFIWLGFPAKELPEAQQYVGKWSKREREGLLLLGNLAHDEFLTLLSRCSAYIRTPACDGVAASVLESLALGVPVIASENGARPSGVVTYRDDDEADLRRKMTSVTENLERLKAETRLESGEDNIARTVDLLLGYADRDGSEEAPELAHAG